MTPRRVASISAQRSGERGRTISAASQHGQTHSGLRSSGLAATMDAMSGDDRLAGILGAIIDQYDAQPPDHRTRLLHLRMWQDEGFHDWGESLPAVTRDDLDDLHDEGFIDLDF